MRIVLVCCLLLASGRVFALESAQEYLSACKDIANAKVTEERVFFAPSFESGQCWGAFGAIQKTVAYADRATNLPYFLVCAPPETTLSQFVAIFVAYAQRHPERLHESYYEVAMDSLREAFPCRRTRK